jgi:2-methylisocitrate lyase-like PEP mutase family enzyme
MPTVKEKRQALRRMINSPGGHVAPGTHDVISALLIERFGFDLVHISGAGSHRAAGFPDMGLLTLTEQVARATLIADAVTLPVIADCETGHGNVVNTVRAVREFERAGICAIHIEDQQTPKDPGEGAAFISPEEFAGKIKAAVDTRTDEDFIIIARMDARDEPYEARFERGMKAVEAGADVIWISFRDVDLIQRIVKEIPRPMMGIPRRPQITPRMYGEMGYKAAILPGVLPAAEAIGIAGVLKSLIEHDSDVPFFESFPDGPELRAWTSAIGGDWATEILKRYHPGSANRGPGGH